MKNNKCANYRNNITSAMELDKSWEECAASKDSNNDASSGLSTSQTWTWMIIWTWHNCQMTLPKWQVWKKLASTNPSLCRTTQCLHICSITNFSKEETTDFIWRMLLIRANGCQWKIWTSQDTQYNFSFM